ncbi:MAG: hypothetical protein HOW73_19910 [Polyangiaceae bacterium]|nr:hypothetical protein [Polyangiaceae bacterium]
MLRGTGLLRLISVGGAIALAAAFVPAGCGGTAVFDSPDPKACGIGHGCPMAGCACGDGSVILDTTCELGECLPVEDVCADRCEEFEGAVFAFGTETDEVAIPNCDTFCARVLVNDCELGCDTLFSHCLKPSSCDAAAAAFWRCVTEDAVMSCVDNAVRIERCDASALGLCNP